MIHPPKLPKLLFFGINLSNRGIPPYAIFFTKFGMGKGVRDPQLRSKFIVVALKNVGLQPPKSRKNSNIWYKFAPKAKFRGSAEKVEYR